MGWGLKAAGKVNCVYVTKFRQSRMVTLRNFIVPLAPRAPPPPRTGSDRKGEREINGCRDRLLELLGYLLLRRPECPPGLFAAVPAAGPSHASTYRPLKTTASSTSCCPAPTTSAATAMVPARPISDAATITPRPELPIRGELFQRTRIAQSNQSVSSTDTLTNRKGSQVSPAVQSAAAPLPLSQTRTRPDKAEGKVRSRT